MTTLDAAAQLTLLELANRIDPKGDLAVIAEVLTKNNPILTDAPFIEANNVTTHKMTRRTSLPTGTWRRLNKGVPVEASQTIPVEEGIGMLESYSQIDEKLVKIAPNQKQFRNQEDRAFIEGLGQTWASTVFYGDASIDAEKFTGLAPRLNSIGNNVVSEGGSTALTSIYIIMWGENKTHFLYPRGDKTLGVVAEDLGVQTVADSDGNLFQAFRTHFIVNCGLAIHDDRHVSRYCNIETGSGATLTFNEDLLIGLINEMPNNQEGARIYCNSKIKTQMQIRLKDKTNVYFTADQGQGLSGVPVLRFNGIPVIQCDGITNAETAVT